VIKPVQQDDAFLADVARTRDVLGDSFRMWWLGQSGFLVQYRGRHLLFDPYLSDSLTKKYAGTEKPHVRISERVVAPERLDFIDVITSTHSHTDHLDAETIVSIARAVQHRIDRLMESDGLTAGSEPRLVLPCAIGDLAGKRLAEAEPGFDEMNAWDQAKASKFHFTAVPAAHDQLALDEQGRNLYLGFVVKMGPHVIYHSGDTVVFDGMADLLRPFKIDVAILPINGKVGNMGGRDAARLAKAIGARVVIPCHYDMFEFNTADPGDEFVPECERLGQPYRVLRLGERFSSSEIPAP
jgi:L-ascorbate metabolism protein UlaG (beta-lactamase superfamily)